MEQIDTCDICGLKVRGKKYDFYYGQSLGTSDYVQGSTGMRSTWKEHYLVMGKSSGFFCRKCLAREFWKRVFSEPRLPEMQLRWFSLELLFIGLLFGAGLAIGLAKLVLLIGLTAAETVSPTFVLFFVAFGVTAVLFSWKLYVYADEFGNEMAYKKRFEELPKVPKLICIPPGKYKQMNPPTANRQESPKQTVKPPVQKETPEIRQAARSAPENVCSKCGYAGMPKDRFCRKCGNPLK